MDIQLDKMSQEDRDEIVRYGIKRGTVILVSTIITLLLGYFFGIVWQSIIFWFSLSILRKYAGGYHADTEKRCYIISFIVIVVSFLCIKLINCNCILEIFVQTISLFIILFLVPVENKNHILDKDEKRKYGVRARTIEVLLYITYIFLYLVNMQSAKITIGMVNLVVSFSLISGFIKNHKTIHF